MDMTKDRLQEAFKYVRQSFFPKWDKNSEWIVKLDLNLPSHGRCFIETKTISLSYLPNEDDALYSLLIHEICHSSIPGHKKKWFDRMLKASKTADKLGHTKLSEMLWKEVNSYKDSPIIYARDIYAKIRDALVDEPNASYESIINWIAQDLGWYSKEVEKTYKQCKKVYNGQFKWIHEALEMQAELRKKLETGEIK